MNSLTYRQEQLLYILANEEIYTSKYLSKKLNVSTKTIHNEIKLLKSIMENFSLDIQSLKSKGYRLISINQQAVSKNITYAKEHFVSNYNIYQNPLERSHAIIHLLLNYEEYILIDDLAEQFSVERSSISRDLKYIRNCLSPYQLQVITKPHYGIKISGNELNKRLCLVEYTYHQKNGFQRMVILQKELIDEIQLILEKDGLSMSKDSFYHFLIHLQVLLDRIQNFHRITFPKNEIRLLKLEYDHYVAKDIAKCIEEYTGISISEDEIFYIALHIIGKKNNTTSEVDSCINSVIRPEIGQSIDSVLCTIYNEFRIDLSEDEYLRRSLGLHYLSMVNRFYYDIYRRNPIKEIVKKEYLLATLVAKEFIKRLHFSKTNYIDEDEVTFLALHFQLALDRMITTPLKVILVSDFVSTSSELLRYHIQKRFLNRIIILDTLSILEYETTSQDCDFFLISDEHSRHLKVLKEKHIQIPAFINASLLDSLSNILGLHETSSVNVSAIKQIKNEFIEKNSFDELIGLHKMIFDPIVVEQTIAVVVVENEEEELQQYDFDKPLMWESYYVSRVLILYTKLNNLSKNIQFVQNYFN